MLFPVVNFLKYVVTDISQGSVATHFRFGRIFSDSIIYKLSPDSDSEKRLKIGQYWMKL